jgi:hypothetical protein
MECVLKELVKNSIVIEISTKVITNKKSHHEAQSIEWDDGSRSDIAYVPKVSGKGLHPVIVEFQDFVDEDYMKKQAGVLSSSSRAI